MLPVGIVIIAVTIIVAWIAGDTETISRAHPYYGLPLVVGAWMIFAPVRRALFTRKRKRPTYVEKMEARRERGWRS